MTTEYFVVARSIHFGACLFYFGLFAFDRFVAASLFASGKMETAAYWRKQVRWGGLVLLPAMLLSGLAWLVLVAATMSGLPLGQAWQPDILNTVWNQTQFGTVWRWRLVFWCAAVAIEAAGWRSKSKNRSSPKTAWFQWLLGALLLGSLAWAGHGREDSAGHLLADILHLLVAGFWPAGLLPLGLVLHRLHQTPGLECRNSIITLVQRFSALSLAAVALLALTGWINAWFLVGSVSNLIGQPYGRWLLAKIILFGFAVAIGAVNLLRLKPRLARENPPGKMFAATAGQLQFNIQAELALCLVIIIVVAILGILPPAHQ